MKQTASADEIKFAYWVPERQRRARGQQDRAAHRLGLRLQPQAGPARREQRLRLRAEPGPLHGQLRRRVPARVDQLQPGAAARHRAAEGDRRGASRASGTRACWPSSAPPPTTSRTAASASTSSAAGSRASSPRWASPGSSTTSATAAPRSSSGRCAASGPRTTSTCSGDFYRIHDFNLKPKPVGPARTRRSSRAATRRRRGPWRPGSPTGTS